MAKARKNSTSSPPKLGTPDIEDYRFRTAKRKNNPPAAIASAAPVPVIPKAKYDYNPHLPPVLRFDQTGQADVLETRLSKTAEARVAELLGFTASRPLTPPEREELATLIGQAAHARVAAEPWLEWTGKREKKWFEVDPVALHIHERISAQAILKVAAREDIQRGLFADPQQAYHEAVQFYKHDIDWANRLILGDSLSVMSSLAKREDLAGKVQMIYIDPPYGIKFASNFQPEIGRRDVKDKEQDLTREPEMVKAYRDTWNLGIHSYLSYLRDRLVAAKELLADTGSIFVQISDENLHRVRNLMDEVYGANNFLGIIGVQKTGGLTADFLISTVDYLLWYGKVREQTKFHQIYSPRVAGDTSLDRYDMVENAGWVRRLTPIEFKGEPLPAGTRRLQLTSLESANPTVKFEHGGFEYSQRWKTNTPGLTRLAAAERIAVTGERLRYRRFVEDFPVLPVTDRWESMQIGTELVYVVQTAPAVTVT